MQHVNPAGTPSRAGARKLAATLALVLPAALLVGAAGLLSGCGGSSEAAGGSSSESAKKVIILGFDGLDHGLVTKLMNEGRLPNFRKVADMGAFQPLATAVPPQSPVAWSDFITGMDAGGHGIYDFVHRDKETYLPYLSTSETHAGEPLLKLGKWQVPGSGGVELLRHGKAFWATLGERGVETSIYRMPANFPPSETATRELSGMGVPDLVGTAGTFSFYTSELFAFAGQDISGGEVYEVDAFDNEVHAEFTAYIDPVEDVAKIVLGDEERLLQAGEWSDWVPFEFEMIPTQTVPAMVRFYLRQVRPEFELYASPINIDPMNQALPVSHPPEFAAELAEATGRFYTQGMPEDTKALSGGVFEPGEFLEQAKLSGGEITEQYEVALDRFDSGLLFYYWGHVDQVSHMMWRSMDPDHPAYDPEVDPQFADVIPSLYEDMDDIVGYTLERMDPNTTLVIMSDHGFTSWRRSMNLNSWLRDHGYLTVEDPTLRNDPGMYSNVDWSKTEAYGLGLNGLYLNLKGREAQGIVDPSEREELMARLEKDLLATTDPATGEPAVTKVYIRERDYDDRGHLEIGPDMLVGYAKGTRCAFESATGELVAEVFRDNTEPWSGDHCMDHRAVPGILITNKPLSKRAPSLEELAEAVLAEFGVEKFPEGETAGSSAAGQPAP